MARAVFRIVGIDGTGTEDDPYRPKWMGRPEAKSWAACYKVDTFDRACVLVESTAANLTTLAGLAGVTYVCSLADLRNNVGTARADVRALIRAYSGMSAAEWWETMVGDYRAGD